MKINTALILCAGYGKRLNPVTINKPKPLIKINDITLLENTINLITNLGIEKIKINTFYLSGQIEKFILNYKKKNVEIVKDGKEILDTGGGILNLIKSSDDENFFVFNPDTLWNFGYLETINKMEEIYFKNNIKNLLMVVNKNKSYDKRFKGDFELKKNKLSKEIECDYIYTGCQIINKKIFHDVGEKVFSISKIWDHLLNKKELYGFESNEKFVHLTDLEILNRLTKNR